MVIIGVLIGAIIDIRNKKKGIKRDPDFLPNFVVTGLISVVLCCIVSFAMFCTEGFTERVIISENPIYGLEDNKNVNMANSFISRTHYNKEMVYMVCIGTDAGKQTRQYSIDTSYIIEDNSVSPKAVKMAIKFKPYLRPFLFNIKKSYTTFYIPENSIVTDFTIDLK